MTTPFRIFTKGEVLPSRQAFSTDIPRASPPVTTASLSTALQAGHNMFLFFNEFHLFSTKNLRYLFDLRDNNITHADFADYADCQLIYLCSSVSLRLTKTDIHPLKSMGRCPAVMLPLLSYKSKLLTSEAKV